MIRRLLILVTIVAGLGATVAVPASANTAASGAVAAADANVGVRAIKSFDCSLLPTIEGVCGGGTTTSAYRDIRIRYTFKTWNHAISAKAIRCSGGDLGPWVKLTVKYHIYTLVPSIGNGVCFKIKWGRTWAGAVMGNIYY